MKLNKIMFYFILMNSTLITISSSSMLVMWIGLEMNMFSFIPLMNESKNKLSSEASLKYFIIQSISSMVILMSILSILYTSNSIELMSSPQSYFFSTALMMKLGMAPFHFWFPEVIEGLNWINTLILLTWQKLAPFTILMYNFKMNLYFSLIILISMLLSGILSWNQLSMKKIFVYSSINHMGWMMSILFFNKSIFLFYFIFYSLNSFLLTLPLNQNKINQIQQIYSILNLNKTQKFMYFFNFLSLGGLPPFTGFILKWLILTVLISNNFKFLSLMMIFFTLMMLFIYTRLTFQALILKFDEFQTKLNFSFSISLSNFFNLTGMVWFFMFYSFL
uniref:NADH-ubiquinone oxidoreductase chain 2 n=1 Tax=Cucujoidea sp. 27 KM-2017 TaxID=2219364 RepID=A0A346RK67_9CUCU|nr:NADH dehydrogenase subunit 2 [Cucujoidea sp. 27 KM-2017]